MHRLQYIEAKELLLEKLRKSGDRESIKQQSNNEINSEPDRTAEIHKIESPTRISTTSLQVKKYMTFSKVAEGNFILFSY